MAEATIEDPSAEIVERAHTSAAARILLDYLEPYANRRTKDIIKRVQQAIRKGPLDPQMAMQAWYDLDATLHVSRELESYARTGRIPPLSRGEE